MSKDKISQYSSTSAGANLNTDIAGINIDEGCPPSGINNAIRALMSQVKDLQSGVSGDTIPIAAGGTGAASAASARAALGVAIDSDVMKYVAPGSAGNLLVSTGADWTSSAAAAVVSSVTAGAGISVSANTGNVTITNTGVTDITAGAGISLSANTGSITISATGGGGFSNMEVFTGPGTWTNPGSITKVKVTVVGGGGDGGPGGTGSPGVGGGGGGGGTAIEVISIPSATDIPITVGTAGGTSSAGTYCSATGGSDGPSNINPLSSPGGSGGAGSGGDVNFDGGNGGYGFIYPHPSPANIAVGGNGGTSTFGNVTIGGIAHPTSQNTYNAVTAAGYGSGGGGGGFVGSPVTPPKTSTRSLGRSGIVIVEY